MKNRNILDDDFSTQVQDFLLDEEQIEWQGQPKPKFSITLLELGGHYDAASGPTSILGFVLVGMVAACYKFYSDGNWLGVLLSLVIGTAVVLIPDFIKNERKKNTKYAVTKDRVFFQLWRWGKKSFHSIDLADIGKMNYQEYEDKSGVIHFSSRKVFDFFTYDFVAGSKRFYPTFEMVPEVEELYKRLEILRKDRVKRKALERRS